MKCKNVEKNLRLWATASLAKLMTGIFRGQRGSLSALGKLVLARSVLEGEKAGAGFRGRRGGDSKTYDMAYFPFLAWYEPKEVTHKRSKLYMFLCVPFGVR